MFTIDFFELLFLAEVCIPPVPIARAMFFDSLSEVHYAKMSDAQRKQMFDVITSKEHFNFKNEACRHFHDRFNPENQYRVHTSKKLNIFTYLHDGKYHVQKNRYVDSEHIISIEKQLSK